MATRYIEACQSLLWRQSFDPGPYAWTWSGWRRYGSPSDETEPTASGSGVAESVASGSDEMEPPTQRSSEAGPPTQRSDEAEPAHLGVGWSCSRALDYSDESMLMVIRSSSLGTLVLVPDTGRKEQTCLRSPAVVACMLSLARRSRLVIMTIIGLKKFGLGRIPLKP